MRNRLWVAVGLAAALLCRAGEAEPGAKTAIPAKDPVPAKRVRIVEALRGRHPRVLFTKEDIPRMKAFAKTPHGRIAFQGLVSYVRASNPPKEPKFLNDATDGQRQGLWRAPTAGLHYLLTGDKRSFAKALGFMKLFLRLEHWETGRETDSGMSSANIAIGAGLLYDWLYHDLDPAFREKYRDKLLLMARRQYHLGHLGKGGSLGYWRNDPQNNHRWHRNAGLAICALAAADPDATDDDWLLARLKEELDFIHKYLPKDGTCHESSSYMVFGGAHLLLGMQAGARCLGTDYLKHPFYAKQALFRMHTLTPGLTDAFHYGDSGGVGGYNNYLYKCAALGGLRDVQAGLEEADRRNKGAFWLRWFDFVWFDPALKGGDYKHLKTTAFWPDLGILHVRDGWGAKNVGATFKCGPFGGYRLNEYRSERKGQYINVAHDDPDANSFLIWTGGKLVAETSRYSKHKKSASHNTILVNGSGQMAAGRGEGLGWTQPATGSRDMTRMAVATTFKDAGNVVVVEGEASGSYLKARGRPALQRFRRSFIWVRGAYILVLDDVRAPVPVEITWLMQSRALRTLDAAAGRYRLEKGEAACDFQVVADAATKGSIGTSSADNRGKSLGWKQLKLKAKTRRIRFASVYNPWGLARLSVSLKTAGANAATVTVTGPGLTDRWQWAAAGSTFAPSTLIGSVRGKTIRVGAADKAPRE